MCLVFVGSSIGWCGWSILKVSVCGNGGVGGCSGFHWCCVWMMDGGCWEGGELEDVVDYRLVVGGSGWVVGVIVEGRCDLG